MTFDECCHAILRTPRTDIHAKAYAKAGLDMTNPHTIAVQALYILGNITHWRGGDAPAVREALKRIARTA
jgi:hypothetical protein